MADIRINALATTASSSASDDFLALDGTTNGTRKLNAYSPNFGGNATVGGTLTVSGTGNSSFGGTVKSPMFDAINTDATGYSLVRFENTGASGHNIDMGLGGASSGQPSVFYIYDNTAAAMRLAIPSSGNLLLGTTTDSANGKLQLATHTTSAGGIGFGTDVSLYRNAAGCLVLDNVGGSAPFLFWAESGTVTAGVLTSSGDMYAGTRQAGKSFYIQSGNSTTALTLDSSQNATFAGKVTVSGGVTVPSASTGQIGWHVTDGMQVIGAAGSTRDVSLVDSSGLVRLGVTTSSVEVYNNLLAKSTTASTTTGTGALQVSGGVGVIGAVNVGTYYGMVDGVTAPSATSGYAKIYVDTADGDLKVIFGDGTVKTIVTD